MRVPAVGLAVMPVVITGGCGGGGSYPLQVSLQNDSVEGLPVRFRRDQIEEAFATLRSDPSWCRECTATLVRARAG